VAEIRLIVGGAGTGKTHALLARFVALVGAGAAPESLLVLTQSARAADELRRALEDALTEPYEELWVLSVADLCARILRDGAAPAGLDPFSAEATRADRVALLLERLDELSLRHHDLGGRPAVVIARMVARVDELKRELVTAAEYETWAQALPASGAEAVVARAEREREFARLYSDHDRMLEQRGTPDAGELLLRTLRLLREQPSVRERLHARFAHVLVDDYQQAGLAAREVIAALGAGASELLVAADPDQAIGRPRAPADANVREFGERFPGAVTVRLGDSLRVGRRIAEAAEAVVAPARGEQPGSLAGRPGGEVVVAPARGGEPRPPAGRPGGEVVVAPSGGEQPRPLVGRPGGEVCFWRCVNERAQAQAVAADVERLLTREQVEPARVAVLVRSLTGEGEAVAAALQERAVPHLLVGVAEFFERAEIRDVLAWLRLLADPRDAGAVVRALVRPPVELRSVDLARCIQIARRRKLDMVSGLAAAIESPQVPPEARERILGFLRLHAAALGALDTTRPDLFVHRLIERLGLRRQQLFAAHTDVVERLRNLAKLAELAAAHARRAPQATAREFAVYLAAVAEAGLPEQEAVAPTRPRAVPIMAMDDAQGLEFDHVYVLGLHSARMPGARRPGPEPIPDELRKEPAVADDRDAHVAEMRRLLYVAMTRARERLVLSYPASGERGSAQPPSPFAEQARAALGAGWEDREEELFGPAESLHSMLRLLRDEVLDSVGRIGGRLGELRLDTDLDVSHGVVRYLELVKLAALLDRPPGQSVGEALPDVNARVLQAATSLQREILQTSPLDEMLLDAERSEAGRAQGLRARDEPSLEPFLPRRGEGLMLSASDIETYRTCPLKYKFARVFRIPQEPTINQRFGILVHQVLERFHAGAGRSLDELHGLLAAGWRRGGFGESEQERQLREKARAALSAYHERFSREAGEPLWFERAFSFRLGPHQLRGRVDRVDRLPDGGYELIDYKTGRPKSQAQLEDDVQLSLYAIGAREAWRLTPALRSYHYVLDDEKVALPSEEGDGEAIRETVLEVGEGIMGQGFEPTPSYAACSVCEYRIMCPAAEK
jgi:DNA helicase-2/ATP-dependent DNA helicase PcrA